MPWFQHDGSPWCKFHLPEAAKKTWTDEQRSGFAKDFVALIHQSAGESLLLDLSGVVVPCELSLGSPTRKLSLPNALFTECVFMEDVEFKNVSFSGWVYFDGTRFCEQALLGGTTYHGETSFDLVDFGPNIHLGESRFQDNAYFQRARFHGNTWCSDVTFVGRAWFQEATFRSFTYFQRCEFGGEADFSTRHPDDPSYAFSTITFQESLFKDRVVFNNRRFSNSTRFTGAVFHIAPEFHGSEIHEDTDFSNTTFLDLGQTERTEICGVYRQEVDAARAYRTLKRAMERLRDGENEARFRTLENDAIRGAAGLPPGDTSIDWSQIDDQGFERLIFRIISDAKGYENVRWLQQTRAPDRGRDLSAERAVDDGLGGVRRFRTIVQCKHWLSKSVGSTEIGEMRTQMELWQPPRIDNLIVATSGRFTVDAIDFVEKHNQSNAALHIVLWPGSHIERLLSERPTLLAQLMSSRSKSKPKG
jgi:hypothetical protein